MTEPRCGYRALPPTLVMSLGLGAGQSLIDLFRDPMTTTGEWAHLGIGVAIAGQVLHVHGTLALSRQTCGVARLGLRIAAVSWIAAAVCFIGWQSACAPANGCLGSQWMGVLQYGWFVVGLAYIVGFAIAASTRSVALAVTALVIELATNPPPLLASRMWNALDLSFPNYVRVAALITLLRLAIILVLATIVAVGDVPDPSRAGIGLRRAAGALRLRALAAVAAPCFVMFALLEPSAHGATSGTPALRIIAFACVAVNAVTFGWFGIALLGTVGRPVADLRRYRLGLAAALSLWCGGVSAVQLMTALADLSRSGFVSGRTLLVSGRDLTASLEGVLPVVTLLSFAIAIVVIGGFARQRGLQRLHRAAIGRGAGIVLLLLLSLLGQGWISYHPLARGVFVLLAGMGSAACTFIALRLLMRLCGSAAAAIDGTASLPQARLVAPA